MSKMEKNGMEKLAKVLDSRMEEHSGGGFSFDFGVIKKDYSLVSNTFPLPIPKKDYSVCRLLANLSTNVSGGTHGGHNSGTGSHSHKVVMPKLKPGDRVLIVWVEGEPVVVRGDIAFAQSCLETGNFTFNGSAVTLDQNNFAGIGVTKNGMKGNSFSHPWIGIRAQIQHLKAYTF